MAHEKLFIGWPKLEDMLANKAPAHDVYLLAVEEHERGADSDSIGTGHVYVSVQVIGAHVDYCRIHLASYTTLNGVPATARVREKVAGRYDLALEVIREWLVERGWRPRDIHPAIIAMPPGMHYLNYLDGTAGFLGFDPDTGLYYRKEEEETQ
jgi:hypothetical protein